jgi:hypothetical protein
MRPPKRPKPPKAKQLQVDHQDVGITITYDTPPADVKPFPKK